jgi:hypothetical protein
MKQEVEDQIVKSVLAKYVERSNTGLKKYGTPLTRNDLTLDQWLTHLQEELMDATLYLERIKKDIALVEIEAFSNGYREALSKRNTKQNIPKSGTNCEHELNKSE